MASGSLAPAQSSGARWSVAVDLCLVGAVPVGGPSRFPVFERRFPAAEAVTGGLDVVGCTPDAGAVMVDVLRSTAVATTGVVAFTGRRGDDACLDGRAAAWNLQAAGGRG